MDWRQQLIIFTRYPELGKVKTRMIPALAAKGAEELHRKLAEYTLSKLAGLSNFLSLIIYYHGGSEEKMRTWLGEHYCYHSQRGKDLTDLYEQVIAGSQREQVCYRNSLILLGNCYDFLEQLEKSIFYVQQQHKISEEICTRQGAV